jgi:FkbM family methyltransferase
MWPTKTLQVQLGDRWYPVKYPFSPAMKQVLAGVFQGREYPLCLPRDFQVDSIVDVGGNVGAAAIWFHHHYPQARIVCYEPSPEVYEFLRENTSAIENIEAKCIGMSDRDCQVELHVGQHHAAQSSVVAHTETSQRTETITLRRASAELQLLSVDRISILKLDTEGCEVPILSDLGGWLNRIDAIYVEYHSEQDRREIDQMLSRNFYLIRASVQRANLGMLVYLSQSIASRYRKYVSPPIER